MVFISYFCSISHLFLFIFSIFFLNQTRKQSDNSNNNRNYYYYKEIKKRWEHYLCPGWVGETYTIQNIVRDPRNNKHSNNWWDTTRWRRVWFSGVGCDIRRWSLPSWSWRRISGFSWFDSDDKFHAARTMSRNRTYEVMSACGFKSNCGLTTTVCANRIPCCARLVLALFNLIHCVPSSSSILEHCHK